jgi:hypothetical protein
MAAYLFRKNSVHMSSQIDLLSTDIPYVRPLEKTMGLALARRTVFRAEDKEDWGRVATRVALGNSLLHPSGEQDFKQLRNLIAKGAALLSGRHLQHGDENQPKKNLELHSNCSTSATSFILFYLLLNGSGVGRAYDDAMMVTDWDNAPKLVNLLSKAHPDFADAGDSVIAAEEFNPDEEETYFLFRVPDSREGWAMAFEQLETMTFQKIYTNTTLVLNWSAVRAKGSPIGGMQERPASGPVPTIKAFISALEVKGRGYPKWKQAMFVDHFLAECVLVGGARRAARMATKDWNDEGIFEFIKLKKDYPFLYSSNNSVIADEEFWNENNPRAKAVLETVAHSAYHHGTGEPGIINVHRFAQQAFPKERYELGDFVASSKYQLSLAGRDYYRAVSQAFNQLNYQLITNPCVTANTWIDTLEGPRKVSDLIGKPFFAMVDGKPHFSATGFFKTGNKPVYKLSGRSGHSVELTADHKVLASRAGAKPTWVAAAELDASHEIVLSSGGMKFWEGTGSFNEGWLVGSVVGDGGHNPEKYKSYVRFWGGTAAEMASFSKSNLGIKTAVVDRPIQTIGSTQLTELCNEYLTVPKQLNFDKIESASSDFYRGFIRGWFDADGTVCSSAIKGRSVRLASVNLEGLEAVQRMLGRLGIKSVIYKNRKDAGMKSLPDGKGSSSFYTTQAFHELHVSNQSLVKFSEQIGFQDNLKAAKLSAAVRNYKRTVNADSWKSPFENLVEIGTQDVYDCVVNDLHAFSANGMVVHNCGEISLNLLGGYCVIADGVPFYTDNDDEAESMFRHLVRFLIRVNLMESLYGKETKETNRIGVSFTGLHEYAWDKYGLTFRDMLDEHGRAKYFWKAISRFSRAVKDEAKVYSNKLGVNVPLTDTTVKPAGSTSKLYGLSEGAHLPSMREYLRWMQFRSDASLVQDYAAQGYPTKELKTYQGTTVVGFPTQPTICKLGIPVDQLVTAAEATPEEQYQYLMLLEKYWITGVNERGEMLADTGNQVSYTLKYDPKIVSFEEFLAMLKKYQSQIKCCSVMPQTDATAYEYQPEQPVSIEEFTSIVEGLSDPEAAGEFDLEQLKCASGACPI